MCMLTIFRSHAARCLRTCALYDIIMKFIFWFPRNLCLYFGVKNRLLLLLYAPAGATMVWFLPLPIPLPKDFTFISDYFLLNFLMSVKRTMSPTMRVWQRCRSVCFNGYIWSPFVIIKQTIGINDDDYFLWFVMSTLKFRFLFLHFIKL